MSDHSVQVVVDGLGARARCVVVAAAESADGALLVTVADILDSLSSATAMPAGWLRLAAGGRPLDSRAALAVERCGGGGGFGGASRPILLRAAVAGALRGGKGGFGAMLRASGKGSGQRIENFGLCRDLSGRRLRHVNDELRLRAWSSPEETAKRERLGAMYREGAGEHGVEGWYLGAPSWAEGFKRRPTNYLEFKRKTVVCTQWAEARAKGPPPRGASMHWGCPRGAMCDFAHGEDQLRGSAQDDARDARKAAKEAALNEVVNRHVAATDAIVARMGDVVAAGMERAKRRRVDGGGGGGGDGTGAAGGGEATPLPYLMSSGFAGAAAVGAPTPARWDAENWLLPLGGGGDAEEDVEIVIGGTDGAPDTVAAGCAIVLGVGDFGTAVVGGVRLTRGSWYYEVELGSAGLMQIGWADTAHAASADTDDGVGDTPHSWGFDGFRGAAWHVSSAPYGGSWNAGDVLGCLLDATAGEASYFLNGEPLGIAFTGVGGPGSAAPVRAGRPAAGAPLFPALSLNAGESAKVNLGQAPFRFPLPVGARSVFASVSGLGVDVESTRAVAAAPAVGAAAAPSSVLPSAASVLAATALSQQQQQRPAAAAAAPPSAPPAAAAAPTHPSGAAAAVALATAPMRGPSAATAPPAAAAPPPPLLKLTGVESIESLKELGLEALKEQLVLRGLKAG